MPNPLPSSLPPTPSDIAQANGAVGVSIIGTGSYVPERIMTNADMAKVVDTSDEWITSRTGIKERRIAAEGETTSDMGAAAALVALEQAGVEASEVDLILVATASPDMIFPSTACLVQKKIKAVRATCMDVSAACSGFLYAMEMARHMITGGAVKTALVIGAEKLTAFVDWTDRNTCVLFGDGAGAVVLRQGTGPGRGMLTTYMGSDGNFDYILAVPGGGAACPTTRENLDQGLNTIKMLGKETFKQAVTAMTNASVEAISRAGLSVNDIACIIPHQANIRIIDAIAERLKVPMDRFFVNLELYGNTGAAAVAIALDEAHRQGRFKRGDKILLVVFGSGLTWASAIVEW
jgi:3-oxoacyl-[acyl-carrier-protein] synthase-3